MIPKMERYIHTCAFAVLATGTGWVTWENKAIEPNQFLVEFLGLTIRYIRVCACELHFDEGCTVFQKSVL